MQLPDEVVKKLQELTRLKNYSFDELKKRYIAEFESEKEWLYSDPQFIDDNDRHSYMIRRFYAKVINEPKTIELPPSLVFGTSERRKLPDGRWMSRVYILTKIGNTTKPAVIVCMDDQSTLINNVELFCVYNSLKVSPSFSENLFYATPATTFTSPTQTNVDAIKIMKTLAKPITISQIPFNPSRTIKVKTVKGEREFIDEFDFRLIRGIVLRYNYGIRNDGSEYALYVVADDSVTEETTTTDGVVIPKSLTVWIPKQLLKYGVDSELYFMGVVFIDSRGVPNMNAISIYPIHTKKLEVK